MDPSELSQFGDYVLIKRIAAGGMGEVYRAQLRGPRGFRRELAIKRILPQRDDAEMVEMLLDEARLSAQLIHPNIAQVVNCGSIDGAYFIAMEYVDGQTLHQINKRLSSAGDNVPPAVALFAIIGLLDALFYAHRQTDAEGNPLRIVHRDVSPQNLMISYTGNVKLLDFGIARVAGKEHKTSTGFVRGKLAYMAPEHLASGAVDHRVDQYAAALVLLETMTGVHPYAATSELEFMKAVLNAELRPIDEMLTKIPLADQIKPVVQRALDPEPTRRFADCEEFADQLRIILREIDATCTSKNLSRMVQEHFAQEYAESRQLLAEVEEYLRGAPDLTPARPALLGSDAVPPGSETALLGGAETVSLSDTVPLGSATVALGLKYSQLERPDLRLAPPNRRRRKTIALVGAGAALALAVTAGLYGLYGLVAVSEATLRVESVPPGAQVSIDGVAAPTPAPVTVASLPIDREIVVVATLAGHLPDTRTLRVRAGEQELTMTLQPAPVWIRLTGTPPGAAIYVDGSLVKHAGATGTETVEVPAGRETRISVEVPGQAKFEKSVVAFQGQQLTVSLPTPARKPTPPRKPKRKPGARNVRKVSARAAVPGTLGVACMPWCKVSLDGKSIGKHSPVRDYSLPPGSYLVEGHNPPSGKSAKQTITITSGKNTHVQLRLQ